MRQLDVSLNASLARPSWLPSNRVVGTRAGAGLKVPTGELLEEGHVRCLTDYGNDMKDVFIWRIICGHEL